MAANKFLTWKAIRRLFWLTIALTLLWIYVLRPVAPRTGPTPMELNDSWTIGANADNGFDTNALHKTIEASLDGPFNIHSVIVERHGNLVAEYYQGGRDRSIYGLISAPHSFNPDEKHDVRSIGKSVTSLLFGIALQQGSIGETSTPVLDFYPELDKLATPGKKLITLEDLLNMSTGLRWQEGESFFNDELDLMWKDNIPEYVLSHELEGTPGTAFRYNGGGTALLADIISKKTHQSLDEYADDNLFQPLGIRDWEWVSDLHGRPMSFNGLRMRPRDLLKIGRLVLDNGRWHNKQIVPNAWIEASLTPKFDTGVRDFRYGYQWWAGTVEWQGKKIPWHAGFGNGGQRLYIVPDLDLAIVTTAGAYDELPTAIRVNDLLQEIVLTVKK
ncbi:MAG: serine hydrolase domain-containing protein [Arenimonas sp.]